MITFHKELKIGYTRREVHGSRSPIFLEATIKTENRPKRTVDLKRINKYKVLSISGASRNFGGQIYGELTPRNVEFIINPKKVREIISIWKKWHLNDLNSGTTKQNNALSKRPSLKFASNFSKAVKFLKTKGLDKDRGYGYGSAWLLRPLPKSVEVSIRRLFK